MVNCCETQRKEKFIDVGRQGIYLFGVRFQLLGVGLPARRGANLSVTIFALRARNFRLTGD